MAITRAVQTCRWGTPTLMLAHPYWLEASQHEWSCVRGVTPCILTDPAVCRTCPFWSASDRVAAPAAAGRDGCHYGHALVLGPQPVENPAGAANFSPRPPFPELVVL